MDALDRPLLEDVRGVSFVMPALQKLLLLACSQDTNLQIEVQVGWVVESSICTYSAGYAGEATPSQG